MNYRQLIAASKTHLLHANTPIPDMGEPVPCMPAAHFDTLFPLGARWMYHRLQELQPADARPFNPGIRYTRYGLLKYGICITGSGISLPGLFTYGLFAIPLSIGIFYLLEIHFLFLFPLLIDQTPNPLLASIRATYKIGVGRCLITVIPIACYMMIGLLRKTNRFNNWYIGCLAIVIWYNHDIRNRL